MARPGILTALKRGILGSILAGVLAGGSAQAGGPPRGHDARARALYVHATEEIGRVRWAEALLAFQGSYRLHPHLVTRYNIAACQRAIGRYAEARRSLFAVIGDANAGAYPELVRDARLRLEELHQLRIEGSGAHRRR